MKKSITQSIFIFILLLIPVSVFAEDSLGSFNFDPSKVSHPYDMVNSKGEIIKYKDYSKSSLIRMNETPSTKGSGKIDPIYFGEKIEIPNDFSDQPNYIINDTDVDNNLISPFIVIGNDGREIVDTDELPFSAISYLELSWANGSGGTCTGTLIGRNRVLTNAHCVIKPGTQQGISSAIVYPGVSGSTAWFGGYNVVDYYVTSNWISTGSITEDFAVLVLSATNNRHAGDVAGTLGIRRVTNLLNTNIGIFGYPGDLIQAAEEINQYGMRGRVTNEDNSTAFYEIDTAGGQSGSALLNASNQVVGVHSSGYSNSNGTPIFNGGPKMTTYMFDFVSSALQ